MTVSAVTVREQARHRLGTAPSSLKRGKETPSGYEMSSLKWLEPVGRLRTEKIICQSFERLVANTNTHGNRTRNDVRNAAKICVD